MLARYSSTLRTGIVLVGVPIAFQLGALAYLLKVQQDTAEAEQWELHSKDVISRTDTLAYTLSQAHSSIRGATIFQDPAFEADQRVRMRTWPLLLRQLRLLVSDNPHQQAQLDRVRAASAPYVEWMGQMGALASKERWDELTLALLSQRGKTLLDAVETTLQEFVREEQRLDRERRVQLVASRRRERNVLLVIGAVAIGLAVAMLVVFTRGLSRRLARVSVNGQRLATGEPLFDPLPGRDDVAALDAVLHQTAARLAAAAEAERRYTRELEDRRQALERTNSDLTFKTQENEMFVYSVSHDLRSPLVNVQGFTRELVHGAGALRAQLQTASLPPVERARVLEILDGDIRESIEFIQSAVTRLSTIVDALLRLSRAGRVQFSNQPVDLADTVARIVRAMKGTIAEHKAEVTVAPLPAVAGDPVAVEQVFANLVGNALNYLDPSRPGRVAVGVLPADGDPDRVTVFVRDNGLGIPPRYMSKLFVPFERLHGTATKGEGIGLALSKRMVDRLGGRIWADSIEGEGTTFYVSLLKPSAAAGATPGPVTLRERDDRRATVRPDHTEHPGRSDERRH
ncbi:MAG: sensor histidine kinase [Bacteroidales bacterium]